MQAEVVSNMPEESSEVHGGVTEHVFATRQASKQVE